MKTNILVDLDTLFDTRMVLVDILNPTYFASANNYDTRTRDNFNCLGGMIFHTFYKNRNKGILRNSLPSNIHSIINQSFYLELNDIDVNDDDDFKLFINTYPYNLVEEEKSFLIESVKPLTKYKNIEIINFSHEELTPKWVNSNVKMVIMYDGLKWLNKHVAKKTIVNHPLVSILLVCPSIVEGYLPGTVDKKVFDSLVKGLEPIIQAMFVDIKYFNAIK